jgi:uncharacterized membrane protein
MRNLVEIGKIAEKEQKVCLRKEWLNVLFFVVSFIAVSIIVKMLTQVGMNKLSFTEEQNIATNIIITYLSYSAILISGYMYNKKLSKQLDKFWEAKKALF